MPNISLEYEGRAIVINTDVYCVHTDDLAADLRIASSQFAEVGFYLADVQRQKDLKKVAYDASFGVKYRKLKGGEYESLYGRKPTEDGVNNALAEDPELQEARRTIADLESKVTQLYALRRAIEIKFEALKELGCHIRLDKRGATYGN